MEPLGVAPRSLLLRIIAVPRSRYADDLAYYRALALRALMALVFPIDVTFVVWNLLAGADTGPQRVSGALISALISAAVAVLFYAAGRGSRGMAIAGWIVTPGFLFGMLGTALATGGLRAPSVHGLWGAVVLAGLLTGARGVVLSSAVALMALVGMALASQWGWLPDPDGLDRWMFVLHIGSGLIFVAVLLILMERIYERLRAAALEEQARRHALQDMDKARTAFFSQISHELRGPLSVLNGHVGLLRRRTERGELRVPPEVLMAMERAVQRLRVPLEDLVDLARMESGKLRVIRERVDLRDFCQGIADEQRAASQRRIALSVPALPVPVSADPVRLGQVLVNLLVNAFSYSAPESEVQLSVSAEGAWAVIAVRDQGEGIPPEQQARLFVPGYRLSKKPLHGGAGMGLGLSISKELVEQHGGRIWVESAPQRGSTFHVALPLCPG
jgi:signal transduction histidine kinase